MESAADKRFRVGLTGGIGSGKSTVASAFCDLGVKVVDADVVARQVVAPGSAALAQIKDFFGPGVISSDGQLNRAQLREIVFADPDAKAWLNQLLHPLIRQQMLRELDAAQSPYSVLVAPLLIENRLDLLVDKVLVVDVPEEVQIERTMRRDQNSRELIQAIMASQCHRDERLAAADYIISNAGAAQEIEPQVAKLHQVFLALSEEKLAKSLT